MQAVAREMAKRKEGKIINIASIAGKGFRGTSNISYAGSKGAVIAMTRIGASQLAKHNINVNAICPGILRTQMWEYLAESLKGEGESKEDAWERWVSNAIPQGRPQTPQDIGQLARYLAAAENVTGQAMNVDGGMEMH